MLRKLSGTAQRLLVSVKSIMGGIGEVVGLPS